MPAEGTSRATSLGLRFVLDASFSRRDARVAYAPEAALAAAESYHGTHMPDEVTRDFTKRMHYAAYRASRARTAEDQARWKGFYFSLRDQVVLGNRKLIFRAVQKYAHPTASSEDVLGECDIVMIHAVAAFNPWLGIRFSTYAFTCLQRALFRSGKKHASDRLAHCLRLAIDQILEPAERTVQPEPASHNRIEEYLREEHPLLTQREKRILRLRYSTAYDARTLTLQELGDDLGISKERVRQLQLSAISKLREVLTQTEEFAVRS